MNINSHHLLFKTFHSSSSPRDAQRSPRPSTTSRSDCSRSIIITIITITIKDRLLTIKTNNLKTGLFNLKNNLNDLKTGIIIRQTRNCSAK